MVAREADKLSCYTVL